MLPQLNAEQLQDWIRTRHFDELHRTCDVYLKHDDASEHDKKTALHLKGMAFYLDSDVPSSIACFRRVLSMDPKFTDSAISLSIIYNDIGRYDEAKRVYDIANQSLVQKRVGSDFDLDRKFALKHIEMGDLYFKFHRYDEALEDYLKALTLEPQNYDYRIKVAKAYAKKGFTSRAIQELEQLCHEAPDFVAGRIHLGLMHYSLGNIIDAQQEWERAQALDPLNPEIQEYLRMVKQATETTI